MMQGFYLLTMRRQRRMQRIAAILIVLALAFVLTALIAVKSAKAAQPVLSEVPSYAVTVEDDRVVIRRTEDGSLLLRTSIDPRSLPTAEQERLRQGFSLTDSESLARFLENYSS